MCTEIAVHNIIKIQGFRLLLYDNKYYVSVLDFMYFKKKKYGFGWDFSKLPRDME